MIFCMKWALSLVVGEDVFSRCFLPFDRRLTGIKVTGGRIGQESLGKLASISPPYVQASLLPVK